MSKKKNVWEFEVTERNRYTVIFDTPVTKDEAIWQYEAQDDNIVSITDPEYVDLVMIEEAK